MTKMVKKIMTEAEFMKLCEEECDNLKKTGIPRCSTCKKNMKNGIDSVTKKISKYIWEYDCDCHGEKKMRLMMG